MMESSDTYDGGTSTATIVAEVNGNVREEQKDSRGNRLTRRSAIAGAMAITTSLISGCIGGLDIGGPAENTKETEPSKWGSRGEDSSSTKPNLDIYNNTDTKHQMTVAITKSKKKLDENGLPRTFTPDGISNNGEAVFQKEIKIPESGEKFYKGVFPAISEPVQYRVEVYLENGTKTGLEFLRRPGDGLQDLLIRIESDTKIRIDRGYT